MHPDQTVYEDVRSRVTLSSVARVKGRCVRPPKLQSSLATTNTLQQANISTFFRSLRFTPDGTCLIANDDEHRLYTYVLPADLLDAGRQPHHLRPWASTRSASSVLSYAVYPGYNLQDTTTTWVLSSETDLPIRLRNTLAYEHPSNAYPWIHRTTEAYLGANSLAFTHDGSKFIAGTRGCLGVFDVCRPGQIPISSHKLGGRHASSTALSVKDNGLVMALAVASDGLLAAGSTNRNVGLWSASGQGELVASFSLQPPPSVIDDCPGSGVQSLAWSPCQRYLLVAERQSDCIQVFDVRNGGQKLSYLTGRDAMSTQRFDMSIVQSAAGFEVWAGGMDGVVRMWSHPATQPGAQSPSVEIQVSPLPVGGISWQPQGAVLATCAGGVVLPNARQDRDLPDDEDASESLVAMNALDTMNIWTIK